MYDQNVSAVMVKANDGSLVGIVSEGDLIRRKDSEHEQKLDHWLEGLAAGKPMSLEFLHNSQLGEATAESVMTSPVIALDEHASLREITDVLLRNNFKLVPIIRRGKLVGAVSRRDLLCSLAELDGNRHQGKGTSGN